MAVTQTVAVHGLGGVGKTQLAVQYAWKYLGEFDAVLWARAESPEALEASLADLASLLQLPEAQEPEQAVQSRAVLGWLGDHDRWLLIADNADTEAAVRAVLERLPPTLPGAVLITSRLSRWPPNMQQLPLDLFSPEQASHYLLARVAERRRKAGDEEHARQLAQELGYLPLALEQAGSFIAELKWTFDRYQAIFGEARPELLNYQAEGGTQYPASVAKTWSISLEQLGTLARALLQIAAWFAPDAIPREIFSADKKLLSEDLNEQATVVTDLTIEKAFGELQRFSLVRLTSKTVSVHRLLQAVEQDSLSGEDCRPWLDQAMRLFNAFAPGDSHDPRRWDLWTSLGPHAEALMEHTKRRVIDTLPTAVEANQFGLFLAARGAYAAAASLFQRSLAIFQKAPGPKHPDVAKSLSNLALLYDHQGQYAKAEPLFQRSLAIYEEALGPEHPNLAAILNNLAGLYDSQGQYTKAEPLYLRSLAIHEKALGPEHSDVAMSLSNLATLYCNRGQYAKAEPLYQRSLTIYEKALGLEHPNLATSLNNLAGCLCFCGKAKAGLPLRNRCRSTGGGSGWKKRALLVQGYLYRRYAPTIW